MVIEKSASFPLSKMFPAILSKPVHSPENWLWQEQPERDKRSSKSFLCAPLAYSPNMSGPLPTKQPVSTRKKTIPIPPCLLETENLHSFNSSCIDLYLCHDDRKEEDLCSNSHLKAKFFKREGNGSRQLCMRFLSSPPLGSFGTTPK